MGTTTVQQPIGSPFNRDSTAREVVGEADLSGKNFIVTGGYSGIGIESMRAPASQSFGAETLLSCSASGTAVP